MHANAQVFFDHLTTTAASLRSVRGVHKRDMTTSMYRFVAQQRLECTQASIVSRQRQVTIAQHKAEIEVFQNNQAVGVYQPEGEPVPEVAADVGDMLMQLGNQQTLVFAAITAFDSSAEFTLRPAQFSQMVAQPARIVDERTIR